MVRARLASCDCRPDARSCRSRKPRAEHDGASAVDDRLAAAGRHSAGSQLEIGILNQDDVAGRRSSDRRRIGAPFADA